MLFALRQPTTLLGLLLGFAVGCFLRATGQRLVNGGLRSTALPGLAGAIQPRSWLDPFGVVAALLAGAGWSPRPVVGFRANKRTVWLLVVVGVVVHAVLTAAGIAAYLAAGGQHDLLQFIGPISVMHGDQGLATSATQRIALGFGVENLACGLLVLLPLPPLELGVALWSTLPKTPSARRLAYRLLEEQWSIVVVLALMLFPIAGEQALLLQLIDTLGNDILKAV